MKNASPAQLELIAQIEKEKSIKFTGKTMYQAHQFIAINGKSPARREIGEEGMRRHDQEIREAQENMAELEAQVHRDFIGGLRVFARQADKVFVGNDTKAKVVPRWYKIRKDKSDRAYILYRQVKVYLSDIRTDTALDDVIGSELVRQLPEGHVLHRKLYPNEVLVVTTNKGHNFLIGDSIKIQIVQRGVDVPLTDPEFEEGLLL
jgi:hypothetical protein